MELLKEAEPDSNTAIVDNKFTVSNKNGYKNLNLNGNLNDTNNDDDTKISNKKLYELREIIDKLQLCEQTEVLKIIERNNIKFTQNKNGIFINMHKLDTNTITDIETFLEYISNNYKKNLI